MKLRHRGPTVKTYSINDIFYSIQGEGPRSGTAVTFVRFSGCNLHCRVATNGFDCDTNTGSFELLTAAQLLAKAKAVAPRARPRWAVFTGGEPLLQLDEQVLRAFRGSGFLVAIETNGTVKVKDDIAKYINWLTVSPKTADEGVHQRVANEVRAVLAKGMQIPKTGVRAEYRVVSPAFDGQELNEENVKWCVQKVKENPDWILSIQLHKILKIP